MQKVCHCGCGKRTRKHRLVDGVWLAGPNNWVSSASLPYGNLVTCCCLARLLFDAHLAKKGTLKGVAARKHELKVKRECKVVINRGNQRYKQLLKACRMEVSCLVSRVSALHKEGNQLRVEKADLEQEVRKLMQDLDRMRLAMQPISDNKNCVSCSPMGCTPGCNVRTFRRACLGNHACLQGIAWTSWRIPPSGPAP
jgi:hypothetical protein